VETETPLATGSAVLALAGTAVRAKQEAAAKAAAARRIFMAFLQVSMIVSSFGTATESYT
jgi:hypothetical protein